MTCVFSTSNFTEQVVLRKKQLFSILHGQINKQIETSFIYLLSGFLFLFFCFFVNQMMIQMHGQKRSTFKVVPICSILSILLYQKINLKSHLLGVFLNRPTQINQLEKSDILQEELYFVNTSKTKIKHLEQCMSTKLL